MEKKKPKVLHRNCRFFDIVLLLIGFYLKGVVCFWIFDVFISSSGFVFHLYVCDFVMDVFVVAVMLPCTHTCAHTVWPIVSIFLFLLLDYYDYYWIKFSNQFEQCCVYNVYVSLRASEWQSGQTSPIHSNRPSSFCDKNSNSKKHAIRKYIKV